MQTRYGGLYIATLYVHMAYTFIYSPCFFHMWLAGLNCRLIARSRILTCDTYFYTFDTGSIPPLDMKALEIIEGRGGRKIKVIEDIGSHWENLAVELGIQQEIIDQIKNEIPSHNHHEACNTVLATWLEGNSGDVSWDTLAQCLITAGLPELADNLKESLRLD